MSHDKLVRMANQIATFFETQPGTDQPDRIANHIRDFWDPNMRSALIQIARNPNNKLNPLAIKATEKLQQG